MRKVVIILLCALGIVLGLLLYIKFFLRNDQNFKVTFFNVGQGDSALIRFQNGVKMLVDCGPDRSVLSHLGKALPFYDRQIDYLIVSHPDLDHYGGCVDVLKRYQIKNIVTNGTIKDYDPFWKIWDEYANKEGARQLVIDRNETWNFGGSTIEFFSPDNSLPFDIKAGDGNNRSVVFRLVNEGTSIFFAGDMEEVLEKALVGRYCASSVIPAKEGIQSPVVIPWIPAFAGMTEKKPAVNCPALHSTILKLGHHGSDSSSGEEFLEAVNPKKAVVSVGKNNFGHPSFRILKRLDRMGMNILRTDELGDIVQR